MYLSYPDTKDDYIVRFNLCIDQIGKQNIAGFIGYVHAGVTGLSMPSEVEIQESILRHLWPSNNTGKKKRYHGIHVPVMSIRQVWDSSVLFTTLICYLSG